MYAWRRRVESLYLNPPDGVCLNVLNTAARHGDSDLAADVFRILSNRGVVLELHHYEALADAYLLNSDLKTALALQCMMEAAGMRFDASSTSMMSCHILKSSHALDQALDAIRELRNEERSIPTVTFNCILHGFAAQGKHRKTFELYQSLREYCPAGPNTATFNILLEVCNNLRWKELGTFLVQEMLALKVEPDGFVYDNLLRLALHEQGCKNAFDYLEQMRRLRYWPKEATYKALVRKCAQEQDERAWSLLSELEGVYGKKPALHREVKQNWGKAVNQNRVVSE